MLLAHLIGIILGQGITGGQRLSGIVAILQAHLYSGLIQLLTHKVFGLVGKLSNGNAYRFDHSNLEFSGLGNAAFFVDNGNSLLACGGGIKALYIIIFGCQYLLGAVAVFSGYH